MGTLTIRLPDDKHERLKELAKKRQISVNKLIEELSTVALAEFDAETRFRAMAAQGVVEEGLALLDKLDRFVEYSETER
jgi:predicted transcriptional regulator